MSSDTLCIGKPAPDFTAKALVDYDFEDLTLASLKGKYVVLFFYWADFSDVCSSEVIAFMNRLADFKKINCEVIAVSCDSHFCHLAWCNTPRKLGGLGRMAYPLVADHNAEIAKKYGVYCQQQGNAYRASFIIDRNQILRQITINDMAVARSVEETLRLVKAFQFTDDNGMVCPAGWKPVEQKANASAKKSKRYNSRNRGNRQQTGEVQQPAGQIGIQEHQEPVSEEGVKQPGETLENDKPYQMARQRGTEETEY